MPDVAAPISSLVNDPLLSALELFVRDPGSGQWLVFGGQTQIPTATTNLTNEILRVAQTGVEVGAGVRFLQKDEQISHTFKPSLSPGLLSANYGRLFQAQSLARKLRYKFIVEATVDASGQNSDGATIPAANLTNTDAVFINKDATQVAATIVAIAPAAENEVQIADGLNFTFHPDNVSKQQIFQFKADTPAENVIAPSAISLLGKRLEYLQAIRTQSNRQLQIFSDNALLLADSPWLTSGDPVVNFFFPGDEFTCSASSLFIRILNDTNLFNPDICGAG